MRNLAAIMICPLLILVLNGCSADAPPTTTIVETADATPPAAGKAARKKTTKRRPKLEAMTKQEKSIKPFAD